MSAARQHGFAEVFALIPVGKAIRGAEWMDRMGKKNAGRLLDGVLHDGYPKGAE